MNHVAGLDEFGLRQGIEDRRANPPRLDQSGRTKHGKVLARVREVAAKLLGQIADRVLAFAQHVQQHQSLGVGQDPAHFRMQPIPLGISIAFIVHECLLPIRWPKRAWATIPTVAYLRK